MNFTIIDCEQRTPEWHAARAGRLTGSRADCVVAKPKSGTGEAITRRDYRLELACERLTGLQSMDGYQSAAMRAGIEREPEAFAAYEAHTGEVVERTGFLQANDALVGCSLDGHTRGFEGFLEMKCPKTATHLTYLRNPCLLYQDYRWQVTHNFWVSDAEWCDLVSYDPRMPEKLRIAVHRLRRRDSDLPFYLGAAAKFLAEVEAEVVAIRALEDSRG